MSIKTTRQRNASGEFPCAICGTKTYLHIHHIEGRKIKNPNRPSNLASICSNCHTLVHRGEIVIEGYSRDSSGLSLLWHKKGEESFTGYDSSPHIM